MNTNVNPTQQTQRAPAGAGAPFAASGAADSGTANGEIGQRLSEIERYIATLTMERGPQNEALRRLEQRLDEIDAKLQALQQSA